MDAILDLYQNLITQIKTYRPTDSLKLIEDAYKLAHKSHDGQKRKSGEPYIVHPLEVALILADIMADMESIAAALLHDVVEDTDVTSDDITAQFGEEVANLVEGVTAIEKVNFQTKNDEDAENFRKMFFFINEDVRVILIKIADRLHNMRTLDAMPKDKQVAKARETLEFYAPIAHRLGIAKLRYALEDLGFKYSEPESYDKLLADIGLQAAERHKLIEELVSEIRIALEAQGIEADVEGRPKQLYSVHKKMVRQNKTLEEIHDLYAVRIIVKTVGDCYAAMGCVHGAYAAVQDRFKDYISRKKHNGYQSLHTTLVGGNGHFEVQIRTREMHDVAELGIAAHWKYKAGGTAAKSQWLEDVMKIQQDAESNEEYLETLKREFSVLNTHITCFTPNQQPINLVRGACVIDFAYAVHSSVGHRMTGAKINGVIRPITTELRPSDVVEIITSKVEAPKSDWLTHTKTNQARTKIKQWFKREDREGFMQRGKDAFEKTCAELGIAPELLLADKRDELAMEAFTCNSIEQMYIRIGTDGLKEKAIANFLYREYEKTLPPPSDEDIINELNAKGANVRKNDAGSGITIEGIDGINIKAPKCCSPIRGDEICGFVSRGRGLILHRTVCRNITNLPEEEQKRVKPAQWGIPQPGETYLVSLRLVCPNTDKVLISVRNALDDEKIDVSSAGARKEQANAVVNVQIHVRDLSHLEHIKRRLASVTRAYEVERANA